MWRQSFHAVMARIPWSASMGEMSIEPEAAAISPIGYR